MLGGPKGIRAAFCDMTKAPDMMEKDAKLILNEDMKDVGFIVHRNNPPVANETIVYETTKFLRGFELLDNMTLQTVHGGLFSIYVDFVCTCMNARLHLKSKSGFDHWIFTHSPPGVEVLPAGMTYLYHYSWKYDHFKEKTPHTHNTIYHLPPVPISRHVQVFLKAGEEIRLIPSHNCFKDLEFSAMQILT